MKKKNPFHLPLTLGVFLLSAVTTLSAGAQPEPILRFDGIESRIESGVMTSDLGLVGSGPKTVEIWVQPRRFDGGGILELGTRYVPGGDFSLRVAEQDNEWQVQLWDADVYFVIPDSLDNWTHVAVTYDGTTLSAYGNGELIQSAQVALDTGDGQFAVGLWRLGQESFNLRGGIRDVRIWNVARSAAEIQATMNSSPEGQAGLALWWPLDEGEGRVARDDSGGGNDGTIFAAQWEAQQFEYEPNFGADFALDFGSAAGQSDELSLLRNRPDHFSLEEDALRMSTSSERFVSSSAVASVANRAARQDFTVAADMSVANFPDPRASRVGLVVLGGPHVPVTAPFDTGEDRDFLALSFYPGAPTVMVEGTFPNVETSGSDTAVIAISRGFEGEILAAARWDGRKPLPNPILLADDFEDVATDGDWWIEAGVGSVWEIGELSFGPQPTSGTRVAGTNLSSPIAPSRNDWLRSPVVDLTGLGSAVLTFREALDIDGDTDFGTDGPFHKASVNLVDEFGNFIVELAMYSGSSSGWRLRGFSLPPEVLGQKIRVEFRVSTDEFVLNDEFGWMIDEVAFTTVQQDLEPYGLKAEGSYGFSGELELTLTLTDLAVGSGFSQSISTTILNPPGGNLFGFGGRLQASPQSDPEIDFVNFSMTLGEEQSLNVPTTIPAIFQTSFGTGPGRTGADAFALLFESDWELREESLQLATDQANGNSVALTRVRDFEGGNPIQVAADVVLTSYDSTAEGRVGLVLFGEESPLVFDPANPPTYYTFQYLSGGGLGGRIAFREGMDGTILYEVPFAEPVVGATYRFEFSGAFNGEGDLEFGASLNDGQGNTASLSGQIAGPLVLRNRFGIGAAQGGGDVWDFVSFSGNTTGGRERFLAFDGTGRTIVNTGMDVLELGIEGNKSKTIEAWVYARGFDGGGVIQLGRTGFARQDFSLRVANEENVWQGQFWDADMFFEVPGSLNSWTHFAIAYTGATINIYANGQLAATQEVDLNTQPGNGLRVGIWRFDAFDGAIRDVRVWNVARSAAEIESAMNGSPAGEAGLLAWWPLNEGVQAIANDQSGNSRDGSIVDPLWVEVEGRLSVGGPSDVAQVLDFDGIATVVETGLTAVDLGIDGTKPKTVEVWVKPRSFEWRGVFQLGDRFFGGGDFSLKGTNNVNEWQGQFWDVDQFFTIPGSLNNWTHIAFAYDGTTLRIYGNGELVLIQDLVLNTQGGLFEIGNWWNDPPFNGSIRDVRIWNVARSASQIRENLYSSPQGQAGLVGWWPLEEGEGTVARDATNPDVNREGTITAPQWNTRQTFETFGSARVVRNNAPATFAWDAAFASNVNLAPGVGPLGTVGTVSVLAPANVVTTYSLAASDRNGLTAETPTVWVRTVPEDGFEAVRHVRFELPDSAALRDPTADALQLARILFYREGARVDAVAVTNPGGDNSFEGPAANLLGDDPNTKWVDFNKAHLNGSQLVFDFGAVVEIDSYRLGTAADTAGRDPQRWRLYGRDSAADDWRLIEDMNLDYPLPIQRGGLTALIPLAGPAGPGFTYTDWVNVNFPNLQDRADPQISGRLATPAGDGVPNLLKYAFGFDPLTPVSGADLPQAVLTGNRLSLTYLERVNATDLKYLPQKSFSLTSWDSEGVNEVGPRELFEGGEFEWVTVELELNEEVRAFLRVSVSELE